MKASTEHLGQRLRELRRLHELTQQELADLVGVSKSLVSKVEAGQRPGSWSLAVAVARALRIEVSALLGEEEGAGPVASRAVETEPLASYLNCFRFGTPPHGGFGLGLGRLLMLLLGLPSIREVTFLFRGPHRLEP